MSDRLNLRGIQGLGAVVADLNRQVAQLKKRVGTVTTVISDDGETATPALPAPSFWRDRFPTTTGTLSGTAATATLTYTPLANSLHLYQNGLELDEGTDYDLADNEVTFTGTNPGSGDVLDARYAFTDTTPDTATVYPVVTITDDFERTDGIATVPYRADGGLWVLSSETGDIDRWEIDDGKLLKLTTGFYTIGGGAWLHWVKGGDYGDVDEVTIELGIYSPNPYGHQWIHFGCGPDNLDEDGIEIYLSQYEAHTVIKAGGSTIYNTSFTVHGWEVPDTTTVHPMTITYNKTTTHLLVDFEGEVIYDDDTGFTTPDSFLGLGCDVVGNGFAYVDLSGSL